MITIESRSDCRTGHRMLQYAFARILSKELDQYLSPFPIDGFPATYQHVNMEKKSDNVDRASWLTLSKKYIWNVDLIKQQMAINNQTNIFIKSCCANYGNFKNHKDHIRKDWFYVVQPYNKSKLNLYNKFFTWNKRFENVNIDRIDNNDIVINIRLGDIVKGAYSSRLLLFEYFDIILRSCKFNRVFITSDDIQNPILRAFDRYCPIYFFQSNYMETFNLIKLFSKVAISQSSYSWWAAYLSDAEEIYFPIVQSGPWVVSPKNGQDLRVKEDRYIYVSQKNAKIMGRFNEVTEW